MTFSRMRIDSRKFQQEIWINFNKKAQQ